MLFSSAAAHRRQPVAPVSNPDSLEAKGEFYFKVPFYLMVAPSLPLHLEHVSHGNILVQAEKLYVGLSSRKP